SSSKPTFYPVEFRQKEPSYLLPNRWPPQPFPHHPLREDDPNRSPCGSADQMLPTILSGRLPGWFGKRHCFLRRWKIRSIGGSSTGDQRTCLRTDLSYTEVVLPVRSPTVLAYLS